MQIACLCNTRLWKALRHLGFYRDSVVLRIVGMAQQAYSRSGLTFEARTKAFFLLQLLIRSAMGSDMFDVRVLRHQHYGGFPLHQIIDFYAMVDVRNMAISRIQRYTNLNGAPWNIEVHLSDKQLESSFAPLASDMGGTKPTERYLVGRLTNLEVVGDLKRNLEHPFKVWRSEKRWKEDKNPTHGYNNGRNMGWDQDTRQRGWYPETVKRALGASRGRSTVRSLTRAVGGVK